MKMNNWVLFVSLLFSFIFCSDPYMASALEEDEDEGYELTEAQYEERLRRQFLLERALGMRVRRIGNTAQTGQQSKQSPDTQALSENVVALVKKSNSPLLSLKEDSINEANTQIGPWVASIRRQDEKSLSRSNWRS